MKDEYTDEELAKAAEELEAASNEKGIFLVEWSEVQQSFHTEKLEQATKKNLRAYMMGSEIQFYPIAVANSRKEADEIIKLLREKRAKNKVLTIQTPELLDARAMLKKAHQDASKARIKLNELEMKEYEKNRAK